MGKRILMIAYVYPPIAYAGTYRSLRLSRVLARRGYSVTVLTLNRQKDLANDEHLLNGLEGNIRVVRTTTADPFRWYRGMRVKEQSRWLSAIIDKAASGLLYPFTIPDHMVLWVPFALCRGYRLTKEEKFDVIYTSSPPHSEQVIGWLLRKITGIPWVADLRDPIVGNIYMGSSTPIDKWVNTWLEQVVLEKAEVVVANTASACRGLKERYPKARVEGIYNCFDEDEFRGFPTSKYRRFTVSHVGSLYGDRKGTSVLKAIRILHHRGVIRPNDFRALFVGLDGGRLLLEAEEYGVKDYVQCDGMVGHNRALEVMVRSHVLLLIKGFAKETNLQIPGKLFEYIGSGSRIVCISRKDSEVAAIIRENDAGVIVDDDPDEIANCLSDEYFRFKEGNALGSTGADRLRALFSCERMADEFCRIFSTL